MNLHDGVQRHGFWHSFFFTFSLDCIYHKQGRSYHGLWHKTTGMIFTWFGGQDGYREVGEVAWHRMAWTARGLRERW